MCKVIINYMQYISYKLQVNYWFQIQQTISVVPEFIVTGKVLRGQSFTESQNFYCWCSLYKQCIRLFFLFKVVREFSSSV